MAAPYAFYKTLMERNPMRRKLHFARLLAFATCTLMLGACSLCHGFDNHRGAEMQRYWDR